MFSQIIHQISYSQINENLRDCGGFLFFQFSAMKEGEEYY